MLSLYADIPCKDFLPFFFELGQGFGVKCAFSPLLLSFFVDVSQLRSCALSSLFKHVFLILLVNTVTEVNFLILASSHDLAYFGSMSVVDIQSCIVVQIKLSNCVLQIQKQHWGR